MYKTVDKKTNLITGLYDGKKIHPDGIEIPSDAQEIVGTDNRLYEKSKMRPMSEVVADGLVEIPVGFKLVDNAFVAMTEAEKYVAGIIEVPKECKLGGDELIPMTDEEQLSAGVIAQDEYTARSNAKIKAQLNDIDTKSFRAVRSILAGTGTDTDKEKLVEYEKQAAELRSELV